MRVHRRHNKRSNRDVRRRETQRTLLRLHDSTGKQGATRAPARYALTDDNTPIHRRTIEHEAHLARRARLLRSWRDADGAAIAVGRAHDRVAKPLERLAVERRIHQ